MDTPKKEVIVEEQLGQDYNPEDEETVFIDGEIGSDSNYDTYDCICHSY